MSHSCGAWLLAILDLFFAVIAILLVGVGLYGVLNYSVHLRRREIGIRVAIGVQAGEIARRVTVEVFARVLTGVLLGVVLGVRSAKYIESLLFKVNAADLNVLALPTVAILAVALLAALQPGDPGAQDRSGEHGAVGIIAASERRAKSLSMDYHLSI